MCNITLIATSHKENGMCSPKELNRILNTIKPDVIFEELSKQYFSEIYNGRQSDTLETNAIKMYSKDKIFKHHPVDVDVNQLVDEDLKNSISNMLKIFDRNSDYQNLKLTLQKLSFEFGFPYLNGIQCEMLLAQKYFLEQRLAEIYEQGHLVAVHQTWIRINDFRESEMLANIYKYSKAHDFENAVFLVGAEHRKPIMDIISNKVNLDQAINWDFQYFSQCPL